MSIFLKFHHFMWGCHGHSVQLNNSKEVFVKGRWGKKWAKVSAIWEHVNLNLNISQYVHCTKLA